jgi:hypothetical protein
MAAKRVMILTVLFMSVLLMSGCGLLCDRYCDRQRDRCHNYNYCQPACAPTPAPYGGGCAPAGVVPTTSGYPQPAYNPYCP